MKNFFRKIWGREAIVATVISGVSVWEAIPPVLAAFGHPLTGEQIRTLGVLIAAVGVVVARFHVVAKDTHAKAVQNALRQPTS